MSLCARAHAYKLMHSISDMMYSVWACTHELVHTSSCTNVQFYLCPFIYKYIYLQNTNYIYCINGLFTCVVHSIYFHHRQQEKRDLILIIHNLLKLRIENREWLPSLIFAQQFFSTSWKLKNMPFRIFFVNFVVKIFCGNYYHGTTIIITMVIITMNIFGRQAQLF